VSAGDGRSPDPKGKVRVGVALTQGSGRDKLDDFCRALGGATGLEVSGVGVWYYHRLLEALDVGDVDVAWLPPILAAQAVAQKRASAIAVPVRRGVSAYSTALFVRDDARWKAAHDLAGARAAWVDRQSVSGYLLVRAHLRAHGVDLDRAFTEDRFLGSHEAVVKAVLDGDADAGATYVYFDERALAAKPQRLVPLRSGWGKAKVRLLAHAGPIPSDVVAASARLAPADAKLVQGALIAGRDERLKQASLELLGADVFTAPIAAHLGGLAALLPTLDEHAVPKRGHWPR
jgi:phosphonate transport system substrate-binding protein